MLVLRLMFFCFPFSEDRFSDHQGSFDISHTEGPVTRKVMVSSTVALLCIRYYGNANPRFSHTVAVPLSAAPLEVIESSASFNAQHFPVITLVSKLRGHLHVQGILGSLPSLFQRWPISKRSYFCEAGTRWASKVRSQLRTRQGTFEDCYCGISQSRQTT